MHNFKHSLSYKVLILYLIFNTAFVLLFGLVISTISGFLLQREVTNYTEEIIEQINTQFNTSLNDATARLISAASSASLPGLLRKNAYDIQENLEFDRKLDTVIKKSNMFSSEISDILVLGNNGYVYNINSRTDLVSGYDFISTEWYQKAIDISNNVYIHLLPIHTTDFYNSYTAQSGIGSYTYSLSFAIVNSSRKAVGAIICNFDLEKVGQNLMSGNYEENGKIALLDETATVISQSNNQDINTPFPMSAEAKEKIYRTASGSFTEIINNVKCLISYQTTKYNWKIVHYVPISTLQKHNYPIYYSFLIGLIVCFCLNIITAFFISRAIQKPVEKLAVNITNVDYKKLSLKTSEYTYTELNQIADRFNTLLKDLQTFINKDYLAQIQINKLRLYALRSQINPHFLMNTLQLLQTEIIYGNIDASNEIILSLSKLLRYTLYNYESEVPVEDELNYIHSYLELFIKKYDNRLSVHYDIQEACKSLYMPKLILQPIVENCFKHAFQNNPCNSIISISAYIVQSGIEFTVSDNGLGIPPLQLQKIIDSLSGEQVNENDIGLSNIHQRIQMRYGVQYGLHISSAEGNGTTVTVHLPLLKDIEKRKDYSENIDC